MYSSVIEHLSSMCIALGLIPRITKKNKKKNTLKLDLHSRKDANLGLVYFRTMVVSTALTPCSLVMADYGLWEGKPMVSKGLSRVSDGSEVQR